MKKYYVVQNYNSSYYEKLTKKRSFGKSGVKKDSIRWKTHNSIVKFYDENGSMICAEVFREKCPYGNNPVIKFGGTFDFRDEVEATGFRGEQEKLETKAESTQKGDGVKTFFFGPEKTEKKSA